MKKLNYLFIKDIRDFILNRFSYIEPDIAIFIACQSALESSYGKSMIAIENHNIFGMKKPVVRLSNCIGENRGHAVYSDKYCCVCDFFFWLQYNGFDQSSLKVSLDKYLFKFKKLNYCPSYDYVTKILQIYQDFKNYKDEK